MGSLYVNIVVSYLLESGFHVLKLYLLSVLQASFHSENCLVGWFNHLALIDMQVIVMLI